MAISEEAYLKAMWDRNECANCRKAIPAGKRVGAGRKKRGGFCCLDCYARYYAMELSEKAKLLNKVKNLPPNES